MSRLFEKRQAAWLHSESKKMNLKKWIVKETNKKQRNKEYEENNVRVYNI